MDLVERHTQVAELEAALRDAAAGAGSLVLVAGEAGAGKTTLVRRVTSEADARGKVLWGMCDELATPRPLGPFRDMVGPPPGGLPTDGAPVALLEALIAQLGRGAYPAVLVVEDAHWADEATVDAIRFLGRRVGRLPATLVVTFRDDEVGAAHPLRLAIGAVPPDDIRRITLPPLSRHGVAQLAGHDDIDQLYRLTNGNPFYVTELLTSATTATSDATVPVTVQDAVMARIGRLDANGRACVETAAVVPGRTERWILDMCGVADGIEEATRLGVLHAEKDTVYFTHELARRAVESSLVPASEREINGRILDALVARDTDPARLTHHAVQAGNAEAIARYAPLAARQAAALDAHREAAVHFRQALDQPAFYSAGELAGLFHDYANECFLAGRPEDAEHALHRAVEIRTQTGDQEALGADLILLADVYWFRGRGKDAVDASTRAIAVLERHAPSVTLARAYAFHAGLNVVDDFDEAVEFGEKAVILARRHNAIEVEVLALNTIGTARWIKPPLDNSALIESLGLARAHGLTIETARAYFNLADGALHHMEYNQASHYLEKALAFCDDHDVLTIHSLLLALRSAWHMELGRWTKAEADAELALATADVRSIRAQLALGLLKSRRGTHSAQTTLDAAQQLADRTGQVEDLIPIGSARAEQAWLGGGDIRSTVPVVSAVFELALQTGSPRWTGETALWLHRAGALDRTPSGAMEPFTLQVAGRWREAASLWADLGRPYEQADALGDADEPTALLEALEILDSLGAKPRAAMVRKRLADMGVTSVSRGPRAATRASPAGLTARQTEVLRLLAEDLTYQEIAQRLHLSVKTVDHHTAAIRAKLNATTCRDAIVAARHLGILTPEN